MGGNFIVASADNWDHNKRTVDGKNTTHAMTSILVQRSSGINNDLPRLKRVSARSVDTAIAAGKY